MRQRKVKYAAEERRKPPLVPKTPNQADYIEAIKRHNQVIVLGPAGTGKTFIAATMAADLYAGKKIDKIILTRPNVAAGRSIGFFPGTLEEKMAPWVSPIVDVLNDRLGTGVVETAVKNGNLKVEPFETMRGRSFNDSFVILDEAQNVDQGQMKMFLTRIGGNTKVIINGDVAQSDLKESSGLSKAIHMVKRYMLPVPIIEFTVDDIVRSDLCKLWIEAFIKEDRK